jgi:hypothetical protein
MTTAKKTKIGTMEILDILNLRAPGARGPSVADLILKQCRHSGEMGPEPAYLFEIDGSYVDVFEVEGEPLDITMRYVQKTDTPSQEAALDASPASPSPDDANTIYLMTVEWCSDGRRGIFASRDGKPCRKDDEPHTEEEMDEVLGPFWMILSPKSEPFTVEQIAAHTFFRPLAEFSEAYGIALRPEQVEELLPQDEDSQLEECVTSEEVTL